MRIGIDARILGHKRSGIGVYTVNLIEQFLKRRDLQITLFADRPIREEYKYVTDKTEVVLFGQDRRKRWAQFYLPRELKKHRIDVYHATWNNAVPVLTGVPSVLTVHDIIPLVVPGYFKNLRKRYRYIFSMRSALRKARVIITDAESTKADLIKYFNTPEKKINPIHLGLAQEFKPLDTGKTKAILNKFGITADYIVNVGSFDKRRNIDTLIEAFALFYAGAGKNCQLVLLGGYDNFTDEIARFNALIEKLNLKRRVIFTNYVSQEEKQGLLCSAKMMVHLSLYEGFCLSILEAMQAGAPVIASNAGSIPEIAGSAAMLVDPLDKAPAAKAIEKLWNDNNLTQEFIKNGYERIKKFSWEKTARETADLYEKIL